MDKYIRLSWEYVFRRLERENENLPEGEKKAAQAEKGEKACLDLANLESLDALRNYLLSPEADPEALLEKFMKEIHVRRLEIVRILMGRPRFISRQGQPLHFMPKLEPDPALLERPLYH